MRSILNTFAALQQFVLGALLSSDTQVSLQSDVATNPSAHANAYPVCIVGAGPTGLTVAHDLEAKGYSTVIFEKQPKVGGKCQAYYDGPDGTTYHPLGALLFTNETYHETLPIIEASGLPITPGIAPPVWQRYAYGPSEDAIFVTEYPSPSEAEELEIAQEMLRYKTYWEETFAPTYTAIGYPNGIPDEYAVPIATWLKNNGYKYLPSIMQTGMVPYGYGDITETPTIYMLQYFTPEVLGVFVATTDAYIVDFHRVFEYYASTLNQSTIHLDTTITAIDRQNAQAPIITYTSPTTPTESTQPCSHVILAFPPTLPSLQSLNMPLTTPETTLFSKLHTTPYTSSAVSVNTPFHTSYIQNPFKPLNEPVAFVRLFNDSDVATAWQWGSLDANNTNDDDDDALKVLLADTITLVQIGANVTSEEQEVKPEDVRALQTAPYFAHFRGEELSGGEAYGRLEGLQGVRGTYWVSGLNGFETVEFAVRAGRDLVKRFF
ncbi:hypothetical protein BDY19DRAFT_900543 [Irpex rosettiformis]|uniref:Uncharacterized protein n=1 Tax=Irpex rosettiformis TaxID=378272 RepID=A0ACB8TML9_9APHY|nr:hypothetical protein BDY19DRAFT_900543 [Irpex rosettiformis]